MTKRYLALLLWGNFLLWCHWVRVGHKEHAAGIAYDAGTFVAMYRKERNNAQVKQN